MATDGALIHSRSVNLGARNLILLGVTCGKGNTPSSILENVFAKARASTRLRKDPQPTMTMPGAYDPRTDTIFFTISGEEGAKPNPNSKPDPKVVEALMDDALKISGMAPAPKFSDQTVKSSWIKKETPLEETIN